jgi:hypothetical protein
VVNAGTLIEVPDIQVPEPAVPPFVEVQLAEYALIVAPLLGGAVKDTVRPPVLFVAAATPVGAPGGAVGIAVPEAALADPAPALFVAVTVHV